MGIVTARRPSNWFCVLYDSPRASITSLHRGCRIVAYSDSEGEDEPFRLTRRHTKKKPAEEAASSSDGEEASPGTSAPAPNSQVLARSGPRIWKAARRVTWTPLQLEMYVWWVGEGEGEGGHVTSQAQKAKGREGGGHKELLPAAV